MDVTSSSSFPWVTILALIPLLGTLGIMLTPRESKETVKQVALGTSLLTLVGTIVMCLQFKTHGARFQFVQSYDWIKAFGAHYAVGVDGIALVLILMTAVLTPVIILASWHEAEDGKRGVHTFFALLLATEAIILGVFGSLD
ncbi:MAG: NADH-quinone oxidoreductase subunit M, partial [Frankiales bacterium]|nr:NADH-quinone oxidoreductase subunit M [Frankiales bacterium]